MTGSEPTVRTAEQRAAQTHVTAGYLADVGDVEDWLPAATATEFQHIQPYRLVIIGEKTSLEPVLEPIAARYGADLYLPSGELSNTLIHRMATDAVADGRPLRCFYFSDADPAGWAMPITLARKLQAFRSLGYAYSFEVHRVGLTPDQVKRLGLPSTPLKSGELRADSWRRATGLAQTEIDALGTLQPDTLRSIAAAALDPFFDHTLDLRTFQAQQQW